MSLYELALFNPQGNPMRAPIQETTPFGNYSAGDFLWFNGPYKIMAVAHSIYGAPAGTVIRTALTIASTASQPHLSANGDFVPWPWLNGEDPGGFDHGNA